MLHSVDNRWVRARPPLVHQFVAFASHVGETVPQLLDLHLVGITLSAEEFGFAGCFCIDRVLLRLQKADGFFAGGEGVVMLDL